MDTIFVTGCAGFIASHVCELLLKKGFKVIGVDNFDPFYPRHIKEENLSHFIDHPNFTFYEADICNGLHEVQEENITAVLHLLPRPAYAPALPIPKGITVLI